MGQESDNTFQGHAEKASIDYLTQIMGPLREIKDIYSRLSRDWKSLSPQKRLDQYRLMESKWEIVKTSTIAICEVAGYPFMARVGQADIASRKELKSAMKRLVAEDKKASFRLAPHPCDQHGLQDETAELHWKLLNAEKDMALSRLLRFVGEAERGLYRCGVLLSAMYAGHDLLGDVDGEIMNSSQPQDMGVIPERKHG